MIRKSLILAWAVMIFMMSVSSSFAQELQIDNAVSEKEPPQLMKRVCFIGGNVEIAGILFPVQDLETILKLNTSEVSTRSFEPQQNEEPCDPTEWPYCSSNGCDGLPITGNDFIEVKPSTLYPGICLYRRCMYRMRYEGGVCTDCSNWAYTTC